VYDKVTVDLVGMERREAERRREKWGGWMGGVVQWAWEGVWPIRGVVAVWRAWWGRRYLIKDERASGAAAQGKVKDA
jgi:hypothetical protein